MALIPPRRPEILSAAKKWIDDWVAQGRRFEYGALAGGNGERDTSPKNGYMEIDCKWLVKRGLDGAGYQRIPVRALQSTQTMSPYFFRLSPANGIGAGDLITMETWAHETGHIGIVESFRSLGTTGFDGSLYHSTGPGYGGSPQMIGGVPVYGPGPHLGTFDDFNDLFNELWWTDSLDGQYKVTITGYWRPRDIPLPGPHKKQEKAGEMNHRDPLIVNLDGAGIQTVGLDQEIYFDHDANGFQELSGWVSAGSGFLMLDWNGNEQLDTGRELFGDNTILPDGTKAENGFQALAYYDANGDGRIDANDPIWSQLRVWHYDYAGSEYALDPTQYGQTSTLDELGLSAIYLDSEIANTTDSSGNTAVRTGHFEWSDGSTGTIAEYHFQTDAQQSFATEYLDESNDIELLPDLVGYGNTYSLHQAMMRDTTGDIKALVEAFASETDPTNRATILDQIIFKWTGADSVAEDAHGPYIDGRRVKALETFLGEGIGEVNEERAAGLNRTYQADFEICYSGLMQQTHLAELFGAIEWSYNEQRQERIGDMSAVIAELQNQLATDPEQGKIELSEFARTVRGLEIQDSVDYLAFREAFIQQDPSLAWAIDTGGLSVIDHRGMGLRQWSPHIEGTDSSEVILGSLTEGDGTLNGFSGNDVIYGTDRNEFLINESGDALLVAGGGNDTIWAGADNDILDGGEGDDTLLGETGNDTYILRVGSGHDTIVETDKTAGNVDTIWIGSFLTPDDIAVKRSGTDLVVKVISSDDTMTVKQFFDENSVSFQSVEQIQFADGTIWNLDEILLRQSQPTEGDDYLGGSSGDDVIDARGGNDVILGLGGDDTLIGGTGNDRLYGGLGNDTINGGSGNDFLDGGTGSDTYAFGHGCGEDTIADTDTTPGNVDRVVFTDVLPSELTISRNRNDLVMSIVGTSDLLTLKDCFTSTDMQSPIELFQFADGTVWDATDVKTVFLAGSDFTNYIYGFSSADTVQALGGDDQVWGRAGGDTLDGGTGDDLLYGESGNDTLLGGPGDDILDGGADDDTLQGGDGYDRLVGGAGDDILDGGAGSDYLYGGSQDVRKDATGSNGNDTYMFGRGSGSDTIVDRDTTQGNKDVIQLAEDITPDSVTLQHLGDSLVLSINGTADKLYVANWFWNDSEEYQVEEICFADGTTWDVDAVKQMVLFGTTGNDLLRGYSTADTMEGHDGDDSLYGRAGDDALDGGTGNDSIYGEAGNDTMRGGDGSDTLAGGADNDVLDGGAGNDRLYGGNDNYVYDTLASNGNDTYVFGRESGQDIIEDYDKTSGNLDTILLDADVSPGNVSLTRTGNDLVLSINESTDTLTVSNWFLNESTEWQVEQIQFADGTTWDADAIKQIVLGGTAGDDTLLGYASDDLLQGFQGNDNLYGSGGNDTLQGGDGDDRLYAGSGDDVLDGGAGNDYLEGGVGDDTYLFGRGSGQDVITDVSGSGWNHDTIVLADDVAPSDLALRTSGTDLLISIAGTDDQLKISGWFLDNNHKIEQFQFSDGTVWDADYVGQVASIPTDSDDYFEGTPANDVYDGGGGNDTIYGQAGDDELLGGADDDAIYGEDGNDTIYGGSGNDYIVGGTGINVLDGGQGDDVIVADEGQNRILVNRGGGFDTITSRFQDNRTETGTTVLKDIDPGSSGSDPQNLIAINDVLFFTADDGVHGEELWRSDGTEAGTFMVKDINLDYGSSWIGEMVNVNGTVFLSADDGIHGRELWKTDGTEAGTVMVKDINPGDESGWIYAPTEVNATLFFLADDGVHGTELWKSDGSEAGTVLVRDIHPGIVGTAFDYLTDVNGTLFFSAADDAHGMELWKSDGTEEGTVMVKDIDPGSSNSSPLSLTEVNGTLFFEANDGVHGDELWKSDGTEAGTVMVKDINPGFGGTYVEYLTDVNGMLFFTTDDGIHGNELWKSDGTEAGTVMVKDINPDLEGSSPQNLANVNGTLFFTANDGVHGYELWKSDGTEAGTLMVKDINPGVPGGWAADFTLVNGTLYFTADTGVNGRALWKTDGTEEGTVMVRGVEAYSLTNSNGLLFFICSDEQHGSELWTSDGTFGYSESETIAGDTMVFGPGITPDDLTVSLSVDNSTGRLELTIQFGDNEGVLIEAVSDSGGGPIGMLSMSTLGDGVDTSGTDDGINPSALAINRFVFDDGTVLTLEDILALGNSVSGYQEGSDGNDVLQGQDTDDEIYGGEGNDTIRAGAGNDIIIGGAGADIIDAGAGDDVIQGLEGGDTVVGGQGDDTYYYNLGDGKVSIVDVAAAGEGNTIVFGEGISATDISLVADSDTLKLHINNNGDEIDLSVFDQYDVYGQHAVDTFVFADGTSLSYTELLQRGFDITGSETDDMLIGTSGEDRITGLGGEDTFVAGPGNDVLDGGSGNDTYVFNPGDGVDTIIDGASPGASNIVDFGIGITSQDLILSVDENTLVITVGSTGDALRLEGFDPSDPFNSISVETFRFADGTVLDATQLLDLGFTFEGASGDDTLTGTGARDLFIGHEGNDQLLGGLGDDAYKFNAGDGIDTITDQSTALEPNMLIFGTGITSDNVTLSYDSENSMLILNIGTTGDAIHLSNFDAADPYGDHAIEYFQFGDGQILTYSQLIDKGFDINGTEADDTLVGTATTDRIVGGDGNDTLSGGTGNDTMRGGVGNDTYTFNLGDGIDLIDDVATASEGNTLKFGEGIAVEDLDRRLTFQDGMLIIRIGTDGDEVHLTGFDPDAADYGNRAVQTFEFYDGTVLSYEELVQNTFIVQGNSADNDLTGTNMTDRLYGYEGFDRLNGGLGNDTLTGGKGNDELIGGAGSDMYVFHLGDGVDTICDTASSGEGNQILFADDTITRESVHAHLEGTTLVLEYGDQGDKILLPDFNYNAQNGSHVVEIIEFADGTQVSLTSFVDPGTEGDDVILGTYYADTIDAKGGNDTVTALEGNDTINAGTGNDTINAGAGDDLIVGGAGTDMLVGGEGQDTYVFNLGDGTDTIVDSAKLGEGNVIEFGAGITEGDLSIQVDGTNLTIQYGDQGDAIVLQNFDFNNQHVVETLQFADGTSMRLPSLVDPATEGDDVILGSYFEDVIDAKGGNDTVTTFESDDTVYGGTGNDIINAGAGYDLIVGGTGSDTLTGGPGNDTYVFNVGDGVDTINDTAYVGEGNVVQFGAGITLDDLILSYQDTTLIIDVGTCGDQLRLSGFDRGDALGTHAVERFEFSDGTSVTYQDLIGRGFDLVGTDGDDTILGTNVIDRIQGLAGNDVLDGGAGADILTGGLGNDTYVVDDPSDLVVENTNEGTDTVQSSIDYALTSNVEDLVLTGTAAIHGTGNELNNALTGNEADNVLDGGLGADTLTGRAGDDRYVVDNAGDVIVEDQDEGMDTVESSVTYTLGANLENLLLIGYAAVNGSGNDLNNTIIGNNANNVLEGGLGDDILQGGAGDDAYVFNTGDGLDTVTDTGGSDTIRFGQGITRQNISVESDDSGIHVRLLDAQGNDTGEGLDINATQAGNPAVETIEFAGGSSVSIADLLNPANIVYGTDGNDVIQTGDTNDIIYALGGSSPAEFSESRLIFVN